MVRKRRPKGWKTDWMHPNCRIFESDPFAPKDEFRHYRGMACIEDVDCGKRIGYYIEDKFTGEIVEEVNVKEVNKPELNCLSSKEAREEFKSVLWDISERYYRKRKPPF